MLYCSGYNWKAKVLSIVTNVYSNKICSKLAIIYPETAVPLYINLIWGRGGHRRREESCILKHPITYIHLSFFSPLEMAIDV